MTLLVIREATAADLDAALLLEASSFAEDPWTRPMLAEELDRPGGIFLVGTVDGRVVGSVIGWVVLDELHVLQVAVDPTLRGQGHGRRLMEALHAGAPRAECAWLEVRRDNIAAITLYSRLGYQPIAERARYYMDGCDAVVMRVAMSNGAPRDS